MKRENIIVLIKTKFLPEGGWTNEVKNITECWGSLTEICKAHNFPYYTLRLKKYPFEFEGWLFQKVPFRTKS